VMYLGELVEIAPVKRLFEAPAHPYTRALLSAIPVPDPTRKRRRLVLTGDIPSPLDPPPGCRFHTRCAAVMERCRSESPPRFEPEPGHGVRCFHAEGASGDGWYAEVEARIEARVLENVRATPEPPRVALRTPPGAEQSVPPPPSRPSSKPAPKAASSAPPPKSRKHWARVAGAGLVLLALLARATPEMLKRYASERELDALRAEIVARAHVTGSLPANLSELGWRLPPIVGNRGAVDPWGTPYRYRPLGPKSFELGSQKSMRVTEITGWHPENP